MRRAGNARRIIKTKIGEGLYLANSDQICRPPAISGFSPCFHDLPAKKIVMHAKEAEYRSTVPLRVDV
jgi:hypothetical protein